MLKKESIKIIIFYTFDDPPRNDKIIKAKNTTPSKNINHNGIHPKVINNNNTETATVIIVVFDTLNNPRTKTVTSKKPTDKRVSPYEVVNSGSKKVSIN
jgi:hypothetical protein